MLRTMIYRLALLFLCTGCINQAAAQAISLDHLQLPGSTGISLDYQNDAISKTDYYYTQGVQLALAHPALRRSPLMYVLIHPRTNRNTYGMALEHDAYTPTSITSDSILYGDRPYAASFFVQTYAVSADQRRHARITTQLSVGFVGPAALGEEMQRLIHENTNNTIPHGWQYQVRNDLILNYQFQYDKNLVDISPFFYLHGTAGAAIGTYKDKADVGIIVAAGLLNNPLLSQQQRKVQVFISDHPQLSVVGYDATLQGGLLNTYSPYIIPASDISRITFKNELAVNFSEMRLLLSGNYNWISREFETGKPHRWGGLRIAYLF